MPRASLSNTNSSNSRKRAATSINHDASRASKKSSSSASSNQTPKALLEDQKKRMKEEISDISERHLQKLQRTVDLEETAQGEQAVQTDMQEIARSVLKSMHKQLKASQSVVDAEMQADDEQGKNFQEALAQLVKDSQVMLEKKARDKTDQLCTNALAVCTVAA